MKTAIAVAVMVLGASFSTTAPAADDHTGHGAMHGATPVAASMTDGLVKKVDKPGAKVTIAHGALANLGMPAMTMVFRVKDKAWLDQMKNGDKIRFLADDVNGNLTIVKVDKVK